ncbi:MAG: molybdopterin-dependent oxidoreductase [Isosphaeraceae bacterium]|nr:molybdopterin-dependent oxidoreductase [Isosphaeraceae bacterium]
MSTAPVWEAGWEPERYELDEGAPWPWDRREFLGVLGGGLVVLCLLRDAPAQQARRRGFGGGGAAPREVGAWIHIAEDGTVTAHTGKAEVGQNIRTSLSQAVADELRMPLESVRMVMADTAKTPFDMGTFGSRTTPTMAPQLRRAAAVARERLIELAAEQWKIARDHVEVRGGKVVERGTERSAGFGELTQGQKLVATIGDDVPLAPANRWDVAGRSAPKVDGRTFVTGRHQYTSDQKRLGMLYGKVLRPPAYQAKLESIDASAAESVGGATLVRDGEFVGVVAPDEHAAARAVRALNARWKTTSQPSDAELFRVLKAPAGEARGGSSRAQTGSIEDGLSSAAVKAERTFTVAYIAHAPLEPRAAVAEWEDNRLTVWTGTQRPFGVRSELAQAFGLPEDRVRVIVPDTGAGYGGKHTGEAAVEAARLARAAKRPVKLVWTREEEFTWAYFRPAGVIEARAGVSKDGLLTAWEFHNYNSGGSGLETPYSVANHRVAFHNSRSPLRQGSYRALASTANHFARESLMDELAKGVGLDPLAFRLKNLRDERLRAVLEAAAERFGWAAAKATPGRGVGLAGGTEKGGFVATCAEVSIDRSSGAVKVTRVVAAFECGAIVNPDQLKNQVEGALVMGLGGALFEAIRFEDGKITNGRFSRYRVPRFSDTPTIEVVLLDRKDLPSAGAGEAPIVAIAPAIGNAIHAASGVRLAALPMVPDGLKS